MKKPLPPPFLPGEVYEDRVGQYRIISVEGARVIFERDDGTRGDGDISGKARIYRNMQSEKEGPPAQPY